MVLLTTCFHTVAYSGRSNPSTTRVVGEVETLGLGDGDGEALALGLGEGDGLGDGDTLTVGLGDGLGEGVALTVGEGDTLGDGEAVTQNTGRVVAPGDGFGCGIIFGSWQPKVTPVPSLGSCIVTLRACTTGRVRANPVIKPIVASLKFINVSFLNSD